MENTPDDKISPTLAHQDLSGFQAAFQGRTSRLFAHWMMALLAGTLASMFLPWTQNIKGKGEVTALHPKDRPQTVNSVIAGQVVTWNKAEGDSVNKGDTILVLTEVKDKYFDPQLMERLQEQVSAKDSSLQAYDQKIAVLNERIRLLRENLELSLEKQDNKIRQSKLMLKADSMNFSTGQRNLEVTRQRLSRYDTLLEKELISRTKYEKRLLKLQEMEAKQMALEAKYLKSKNQLINSRIERNSLRADYLGKINKAISERQTARSAMADARGKLADMRNKLSNFTIRQDYYHIRAPRDGYLVRAYKEGIGEMVKEGDAVFSVVPDVPKLAAELYITAADLPFIKKGRQVRCIFEGYPNVVFAGFPQASIGTFPGTVAVIDNVTSKKGNKTNQFRILVKPNAQTDEAWPEGLRYGAGVQGWVQLAEVPLWFEIWRKINGFPPSPPAPTNMPKGQEPEKKTEASLQE